MTIDLSITVKLGTVPIEEPLPRDAVSALLKQIAGSIDKHGLTPGPLTFGDALAVVTVKGTA